LATWPCTAEQAFGPTASPDFRVFYVGRDDVHGILDGIVAFEGSTNWSSSGEGTGITLTAAKQAPGFRAQNNTLAVFVNPYEIAKFSARLNYEHAVAGAQPQPTFTAAAAAAPTATGTGTAAGTATET
jgi:hypothetical protein